MCETLWHLESPMPVKYVGIADLPNYIIFKFIQPNAVQLLRLKLPRWSQSPLFPIPPASPVMKAVSPHFQNRTQNCESAPAPILVQAIIFPQKVNALIYILCSTITITRMPSNGPLSANFSCFQSILYPTIRVILLKPMINGLTSSVRPYAPQYIQSVCILRHLIVFIIYFMHLMIFKAYRTSPWLPLWSHLLLLSLVLWKFLVSPEHTKHTFTSGSWHSVPSAWNALSSLPLVIQVSDEISLQEVFPSYCTLKRNLLPLFSIFSS